MQIFFSAVFTVEVWVDIGVFLSLLGAPYDF